MVQFEHNGSVRKLKFS